jgi:magnesium-transporting ATPase (P-type)
MGKKTQTLEGHVSGQANTPLSRPAHALTYSKVTEEIGCNAENGLTSSEATKRHEQYGNNDLGEDGGVQPAKILLRQVANAMTLVRVITSHTTRTYLLTQH